jgi:hypothetical protein
LDARDHSVMNIDREELVRVARGALEAEAWSVAAWLGGSDATGRRDRFSDIDLVAAVEDERVEEAFAVVKGALERLSPIELEWRVPPPSWHGHEQVFWRLRDADPHLMVDFVVMKKSAGAEKRFLERERHGTPLVLFDRAGFCAPVEMEEATHAEKMRARLARLRVTFPMFQPLVVRAVERGQACDASYFYFQLTLLPLVEVLRMVHCPERFDFGMRYLFDDLPSGLYAEVSGLALPGSLEGIARCRGRAEVLFAGAVAALDAAKDGG